MRTRLLEARNVLRATVKSAELLRADGSTLVFRTTAVQAAKKAISSADSDMVNQHKLAAVGQEIAGRLAIDVLSDTMIRVRYAEGDQVPENRTPMVVGHPEGPTVCQIDTEACDPDAEAQRAPWLPPDGPDKNVGRCVAIKTSALRIAVRLDPLRIEIRTRDGRRICGIGGREKDHFGNWDSYNTGVCRGLTDGGPIAVESFDLRHDECIYGLGEKFIKLNKVGQTIDLNMVDALGVTTPRSYKNIPFHVSTGGYGVFFNHSSLMTWWVGSQSACDVQVAAEDEFLDYYVMTGTIKEVLRQYTGLTGRGEVPPDWTFGYWQSKISYKSAEETLDIARRLRENEIPCDVIHLDTHWFKEDWYCNLEFDAARFPDPRGYLKALADMGIKVSLWQLPYIPEGSRLFADLKAVDGFVKNADGGIYNCGICFTKGFKGIVGVVDYTNPKAVQVHQQAFRQLFRLGAKVIKTDFGEAAPLDGVYHDGTPGHRMHNLYPLLYNKAVSAVTKEETGSGVVWARSAWAGSQRYPLHWGGDNSPNYFNMAPQIEGGLSFGLSGFQFWSQDIGGFCGTTNDLLLVRWMQLGMFVSHSRIHGFGDRELYKFAPETMRICREYIRLRYRLMPYILGTAADCVEKSLPMMRALVVEYQSDPNTWNLGDEYLFGDSILVAPIFTESGERRVYLPAGRWTDWWTGERFDGGRWMHVAADIETLPLLVREGAVIPMGPVMNYVGERRTDEITLRIAPFAADGLTVFKTPVNGKVVPIEYECRGGAHEVRIGPSDSAFSLEVLGEEDVKVTRA